MPRAPLPPGSTPREKALARFRATKRFASRDGRVVVRDAELAAVLRGIATERGCGRRGAARADEALPAA